jgi:hypothetical protein
MHAANELAEIKLTYRIPAGSVLSGSQQNEIALPFSEGKP